jgi:putative phosphoesterase
MKRSSAAVSLLGVARIGVISDTHGVLHPKVRELFRSVDHILHAGDIGGMHVISELEELAPVSAVPGNVDGVEDAILRLEAGGLRILLTHILPRPRKEGAKVLASLRESPADLLIFGHSHLPHNELIDGVQYFNPASAGPRRFDYPISVGLIEQGVARHVALDDRSIDALEKRMNQLTR